MMTMRAMICGALLGFAGACSAADATYTYTGNWFDENNITVAPTRLVAHFVFDFDHSPQAANNRYAIKRWDVDVAGMHFDQSTPSILPDFEFSFDSNKKIVDWSFGEAAAPGYQGFMSSSARFNYFGHAIDMAALQVVSGPYASVTNKPGIWTVSAVPEPAACLTLIAGLACMAGLRRRAPAKC